MAPNVVLVTGVADQLGGQLAARLAADPEHRAGARCGHGATGEEPGRGSSSCARTSAARKIAKVIDSAEVDTVVHAATRPSVGPRRAAIKELNVIGTMQLLAACQRSPLVRKLVVKSTAEVYGASASSPAVFTEQDSTDGGRDAAEIEGYVRGFARRRPDVSLTTVRLAELIGPGVDNALARYFSLPVVPTVLGFDARVQLLHFADALAVLDRADHPRPARRVQRGRRRGAHAVPGDPPRRPDAAADAAGRDRRRDPAGPRRRATSRRSQAKLLNYGRVIDTTRLKTKFGFTPRWTTAAAFDDYVHARVTP